MEKGKEPGVVDKRSVTMMGQTGTSRSEILVIASSALFSPRKKKITSAVWFVVEVDQIKWTPE
jgi:hypothetical protein